MPGHGDDYERDQDPLAYMTTDDPSPYLVESRINMQRRFLWRGLYRNHGWKRTVMVGLTIMCVGTVLFALLATIVGVLRAIV